MREMTGDLLDLREARFKEINASLKHLSDLSFDELKSLYNELCASKSTYLKYLTRLEIKQNKITKLVKLLIIGIGWIALFWLVSHDTPIWISLFGAALALSAQADCLSKDVNPSKNQILNTFQNSLNEVNNLILEKEKDMDKALSLDKNRGEVLTEKQYSYTLSSVFPTPEIEEMAMKVVRDKNEQDLKEEQELTLKRNLTKENN